RLPDTPSWSKLIGTDRTGLLPLGNAGSGVYLSDVAGVHVGAPAEADRRTLSEGRAGNVIGNNGGDGITLYAPATSTAAQSYIAGNRVGAGYDVAHPSSDIPMPTAGNGIALIDSSKNWIA